jgi:hypothetical protein
MIATTIEQSKELVRLGLGPKTADMVWVRYAAGGYRLEVLHRELFERIMETDIAAWSLSALLEVMPRPDLYRETADLWVCVTFFKEGSIRGFGETAIEATCDTITKMFGRGYLKKKGYNNE